MTNDVVYVYGVARAPSGRKFALPRLEGIVAEAPVYPLVHANLMAFVSAVPASQFGESEFRSALKDVEWLKGRVLAHEKILGELRSSCGVVPFRFGTVYFDSSQVSNALARHEGELCEALNRIRDASEWGVKLYCDHDRLRRRIETEPGSVLQLRDMLADASPGARFFLEKKYAKALHAEIAATVVSSIELIHHSLDACARESAEIDVQPAAVHGRSADMVMNAAYLVEVESLARFRRKLAALQRAFAARGFDHELTGPWPPYHFVSIRQEGVADAVKSIQ